MRIFRSFVLRMKNVSEKFVDKITSRILCSVTIFQKSYRLSGNAEKCGAAGRATGDNIIPSCELHIG
jgi:hypothetical protein